MNSGSILDVRYGLRNRLRNTKYHNCDTAIPKTELTPEKEPELQTLIRVMSSEIAADPSLILVDTYTDTERQRDWVSLVRKVVDIDDLDARSRPGHKLLDHHMRHFWDVANYRSVSVRSLCTPERLEKALYANVQMHSTPYKSEIRRALVITGGLSHVTKYRTVTAKGIVEHFGARSVLDPCVGWGGRMLGALAAAPAATYVGCEPDPNTFRSLVHILADVAVPESVRERATVYNATAESVLPTFPSGSFDMVLTSPPYFNLELYTGGAQSVTLHPTWDIWVERWYKPLILAACACLKADGVSCWSVKNFRSDGPRPLADVTEAIHKAAGWECVLKVSMTGSGRPGARRVEEGKETRGSEEITYCFRRRRGGL